MKKIGKFLTGLFLLLALLVFLACPQNVLAAEKKTKTAVKKAPVTKLVTSPNLKNGENNWFTSVTLVELNSNMAGKTYFQWNSTKGDWARYTARFRAWRGENILYFYSVSASGVKETVQSKMIKIDYERPIAPVVAVKSVKEGVQLVWQKSEKNGRVDIIKATQNSKIYASLESSMGGFIDPQVEKGKTYVYRLIMSDEAGLISQATRVSVNYNYTEKPIVKQVAPAQTAPKTIAKNIGKGESTQIAKNSEKKEEVKTGETKQEEPKKEQPRDWSRLLIALAILVIAAAAAIGGYYGYEWWANREDKPKNKSNNQSRW